MNIIDQLVNTESAFINLAFQANEELGRKAIDLAFQNLHFYLSKKEENYIPQLDMGYRKKFTTGLLKKIDSKYLHFATSQIIFPKV